VKGTQKEGGEPARGEEENLNKLRGGVSHITVQDEGRADKAETPEGERCFSFEIASEETFDVTYKEGKGEGRNSRH